MTVQEINKEISRLHYVKLQIQAECEHIEKISEETGDTGNYDKTQDKYWTENYCPICEKRWDTNIRPARSYR